MSYCDKWAILDLIGKRRVPFFDCLWRFVAPDNHLVRLTFHDVSTSRLGNSGNAVSVVDGFSLFGGETTKLKFVGPTELTESNRHFLSSTNYVTVSLMMVEDCTGRGLNFSYEFVEQAPAPKLIVDSNTTAFFTAFAAGIIACFLYANDIFQFI